MSEVGFFLLYLSPLISVGTTFKLLLVPQVRRQETKLINL